jgi:hypothetical protein
MAGPNASFTELTATTLKHYSGVFADNIGQGNLLLWKLKEKDHIRKVDGGSTITEQLLYAEGNYQRYSGSEPLNTGAADSISAAEFDWKQAASVVTANGREIRINSGKARLKELVKTRIKVAMLTMENGIGEDLYSDGTADSGKQIGGLQLLIQDDPTASSTIGGINQSTQAWWRNKICDLSVENITISKTTIKQAMNTLWLRCKRGKDTADLIVMHDNHFLFFDEAHQDLQRYLNAKLAEAGFDAYKYKTADVMADPGSGIPTNRTYFINTDYLSLVVHKDADFVVDEKRLALNQDAEAVPVLFMGNLTCSNRSLQGVILP